MLLEDKRQLLLQLDLLIRSKAHGNYQELSKRLGISRNSFYRLLTYMRNELHAPVAYNSDLERYVYTDPGMLYLGFLPDDVIDRTKLNDYLHKIDDASKNK